MNYYTRRHTGHSGVFTAERYERSIDPDGRERHLAEEREQKLDDMREHMREELDFLKALAPGRLLEVGCGLGFALEELRRHGWLAFGVEPSESARDLLNDKGVVSSLEDLDEVLEVVEVFDAVLCYHVIEHVPNPELFLTEIRRCMKPHAWLVLSTPDFGSPIAELYGERFRLLHDPTHISLFTRTGLHNMLTDFGFRVERVSTPFFGTRHHTAENIERLKPMDEGRIRDEWSPPGPGNIMTFYARRKP